MACVYNLVNNFVDFGNGAQDPCSNVQFMTAGIVRMMHYVLQTSLIALWLCYAIELHHAALISRESRARGFFQTKS